MAVAGIAAAAKNSQKKKNSQESVLHSFYIVNSAGMLFSKALFKGSRSLFTEYRAHLIGGRALLRGYGPLFIECRALLIEYRAHWIGHTALFYGF